MVYLHIYKTRTGYELIASTSADISDNMSILDSWHHFTTKREAVTAAREYRREGCYAGSLVRAEASQIEYHNF